MYPIKYRTRASKLLIGHVSYMACDYYGFEYLCNESIRHFVYREDM